jgi:hypothetical protein
LVASSVQLLEILSPSEIGKSCERFYFKNFERTFTRSFRYTFSLFGAVRLVFLLRPPAFKSIPYTSKTHAKVADQPKANRILWSEPEIISGSRTREPKSNHEKGSSEPIEVRNKPEITQYASDKKKKGLET